jgi:hypothetical protein
MRIRKVIDHLDNCKIPEWAMSSIFNSDDSGLFGNDVTFLYSWMAWMDKQAKEIGATDWIVVQDDEYQEGYFDSNPEFGLPCNVYDCSILYLGEKINE